MTFTDNPLVGTDMPVDRLTSRLDFARFDEQFLEKSWEWLRNPEIKKATMTPDFTREEQRRWFRSLPERDDYLIWGLSCDGRPIGAAGLKHVDADKAEYWGYIGEPAYQGIGLGREMMNFIVQMARERGLRELYLKVHRENDRALQLYIKSGFTVVGNDSGVIRMQMLLDESKSCEPAGLSVRRYEPGRKGEWDNFLATAKNATFLFRRDYMDYHADRFRDHSLMAFVDGKLAALLPANEGDDGTLISHEGLTYGGLVVHHDATLHDVLLCFHACLRYLDAQGIRRLLYKQIPRFYNALPDDEVTYALFLLDARLYRRDCAVVVPLADRLPFQERRRRQIKKAWKNNLRITQESDFTPFWKEVLTPSLAARHKVKPVHTVEEITLLASRFPENIKQFSVYQGSQILAGTTIYETPTVAATQYIGVTEAGRKAGALDFLISRLIEEYYRDKRFFNLGICNENEGRSLNHGLMDWKEGFGGRTSVHNFHEISTANYPRLESVMNGEPNQKEDSGN